MTASSRDQTESSGSLFDQWWRLGGAVGIGFVVLFIIGAIIIQGNTPMTNDSAAKIKDYFVNHHHAYILGDVIIAFAFVLFLLPFASALSSLLGLAEGSARVFSRLVFAGALLFTAVGGASSGLQGSLAYSAAGFADDNLLKTLVDANNYIFQEVSPLAIALMMLASSLVILRTGILWRWLAWYGFGFSVLAIIATFANMSTNPNGLLSTLGFVVFASFGVWVIAVSVGMWTKRILPDQ